jgi:hypothetical protein
MGLAAERFPLGRVADRLVACVHVARAARRERHSRVRAGLGEAEGAEPERHDERDPPGAGGAEGDEHDQTAAGDEERRRAGEEPPAALERADVRQRMHRQSPRETRQARIWSPCSR